MVEFEQVFKSDLPARDKFLARLFGIFSEDAVRFWANCPESPYEDLGRPTLRAIPKDRGSTLDFALRSRVDGRCFVAEMKCELEYRKYRYMRLVHPDQLTHHTKKTAFQIFLKESAKPGELSVKVAGETVRSSGGILVWGSTSEDGIASSIERYGFHDILSIEEIIRNLQAWRSEEWELRVAQLRSWANELFDELSG
jgi:hypothetical protein